MAGVVPSKNRSSGRKQWTLHDGPRGSLRRLRSQLASDGCPESQVVLAKQLFEEECELEIDRKENARLGVYWLIKASEQGNCEATDLLKKCLITGRGITEHNYLDVKSCIGMTQDEKIARKAAREMFASLSNGEEFITSEQLQRRMLEIQAGKSSGGVSSLHGNQLENGELVNNIDADCDTSESSEETDWSSRSDARNEKLTEDHLVSAAVNYSHGHLPLVNRALTLSEPALDALDHIPIMQRSILHPLLAIKILYYKLIWHLGSRSFSTCFPFTRTEFQLFLLVVYALFSTENIALLVPTVLFYASFVAMVILTFKVVQSSRDFRDFRLWSGLFLTYSGGSLNADQAEFQFVRNNMKPYGHFFLALLVNLVTYPVIAEQWIPQSEITIVAFCLTFMSLLTFQLKARGRRSPDLLILLSFAVNVVAKYPYEIDPVVAQGWRFLDLKVPTFASYIVGNGIEFCLNFRLVFYVVIPIIFWHVAKRDNWRGTYKYFIPHCVTLSWLQVVVINSQGATMFGLLRGTLALVGAVLFLPLVGLTTVLLPAAAVTKWLITQNSLLDIAACVAVFTVAASFVLTTRFNKFVSVLLLQVMQVVLAVFLALFAGYTLLSPRLNTTDSRLFNSGACVAIFTMMASSGLTISRLLSKNSPRKYLSVSLQVVQVALALFSGYALLNSALNTGYEFDRAVCLAVSTVVASSGLTVAYLLAKTSNFHKYIGILLQMLQVVLAVFLPLFAGYALLSSASEDKNSSLMDVAVCLAVFTVVASSGLTLSYLLLSSTQQFKQFNAAWQFLQVSLALFAGYALLSSTPEVRSLSLFPAPLPIRQITWEQFQQTCHQPAWDATNIANTQISCYKLAASPVSWSGYVNEVKLKSVRNNFKYILDKFPTFLINHLTCHFGEITPDECENHSGAKAECLTMTNELKSGKTCSLDSWNRYEFEMSVRMQSGIWGKSAEVILIADHPFANFSTQLKTNDKIWFNGELINNPTAGSDGLLGGLKPHVYLREIGCLACHNMSLTSFKPDSGYETDIKQIFSMFYKGLKFVLNLLFNAVVTFK